MRMREGLITAPQPLALFYTPYADWIYTVVSTTGLLLFVWLVLRPK